MDNAVDLLENHVGEVVDADFSSLSAYAAERDRSLLSGKPCLGITSAASNLWKEVKVNMAALATRRSSEKAHEHRSTCWRLLEVSGTSGSGKSCALMMIGAAIQEEFGSDNTVLYSRDGTHTPDPQEILDIGRNFVILLDQCDDRTNMDDWWRAVNRPNIVLITSSSSNDKGRGARAGGQYDVPPKQMQFDAGLPLNEFASIVGLDPSQQTLRNHTFQDWMKPFGGKHDLFAFTQGHIKSGLDILDAVVECGGDAAASVAVQELLVTHHSNYMARAQSGAFYGALVDFFQRKRTELRPIKELHDDTVDHRYFVASRPISPLIFQSYDRYLHESPPIPAVTTETLSPFLTENPSVEGFAIERVVLSQDAEIKKMLMRFAEVEGIAGVEHATVLPVAHYADEPDWGEICGNASPPYIAHAYPYDWNEPLIDAYHLISNGSCHLLVANQITKQSAPEHKKSLAFCRKNRSSFLGGISSPDDVIVRLLFTCQQGKHPKVSAKSCTLTQSQFNASNIKVFDYSLGVALGNQLYRFSSLQNVDMSLREITLTW